MLTRTILMHKIFTVTKNVSACNYRKDLPLPRTFRHVIVILVLFLIIMLSYFHEIIRTFVQVDKPVHTFKNHNYSTSSVFYVWCGSRWFGFSHYLSVLSVQRHLRPDNIIFYYEYAPVVDKRVYHTWFNEIQDEIPFFDARPLRRSDHACLSNNQASLNFITNRISTRGGIYVNESTVLSNISINFRQDDLVLGMHNRESIALFMSKRRHFRSDLEDIVINLHSNKTTKFSCVSKKVFINQNDSKAVQCITLNPSLYPKDIWELDDPFGRFIRTLFYGGPEIRRAIPSYDTLVPNIAHMIWTGGEMDFLYYLGVLSLVYIAQVDTVYIHGDAPPTGRYWNLLKNNTKIQLVFRESIGKIYATEVKNIAHQSDTWRVDLMIKYGGIYMDTDAVFVRPLDQEIRGYDAMGTLGFPNWYRPFPNVFQLGVLIGKKNAPFWHKFQKSMKGFRDDIWGFNACYQPYKIHERQPNLVKIEPRFQVECFMGKCHPTWWPDYQNDTVHHLNSPSIKNWRKDAYAFHWTGAYPKELLNPSNLLKSKSMFAEIGQHILEQAGMLEYFKKNS